MPLGMQPLDIDDPLRIGDYRLLRRLGTGGMGRVYLGRSPGGRTVAVKVVHPHFAGDAEFRVRFRREVESARRVGGLARTAPVLDADPEASLPWVATGYVAGPALQEAVSEHGPLPAATVRAVGAGLAEALGAVHDLGLVHRDVKPSNVLLTLDGPCLIDFGIARATDSVTALTASGASIGSPGYMSPEQALGRGGVNAPSDVFSLGAVLAYAATGAPPFPGDSTAALLYQVVHEEPDLDGFGAEADELRTLIRQCLAKQPDARPTPALLVERLAGPGVMGSPTLSGGLPAPLVEQISRRAVELLNLEPERRPSEPSDPLDPSEPSGAGTVAAEAAAAPGPVAGAASGPAADSAAAAVSGTAGGDGPVSGLVPFSRAAERPPGQGPSIPSPPGPSSSPPSPSSPGPASPPPSPGDGPVSASGGGVASGGAPSAGSPPPQARPAGAPPPGSPAPGLPSSGSPSSGAASWSGAGDGRSVPPQPVGPPPSAPPPGVVAPPPSHGRFSVSANASTETGGHQGGAGRRLSCTLVLTVAGMLVAVLAASTMVFDLLPGSGGSQHQSDRPPGHTRTPSDGSSGDDGATPGETPPGDREGDVPVAFHGTWQGELSTEDGLPAGTLRVTIGAGETGERVASGKVDLAGTGCSFEWTLSSAGERKLVMRASPNGGNVRCTGGSNEEFELADDGTLRYRSHDPAGGSPTATLRKIG